MTPPLYDWCYQKDRSRGADYKPNLRAFLGRFVRGDTIDNENYMKTWRDDVWELRAQFEPRARSKPNFDNTRMFCAFPRTDTLVVFHPPSLRSQFGGIEDPKWDDRIDDAIQEWNALFGAEPRVPSDPFSKCVRENYIDHVRGESG